MNATIGNWLFSTLGARESRALRQPREGEPGATPIIGVFNPDAGAVPDALVNRDAFQARYGLDLRQLKGSEIGEGVVPDKSELQERVRRSDNPCQLDNNAAYVVTETDVLDLRYVARSGEPVWNFIKTLHTFDPGSHSVAEAPDESCQQQLQTAQQQIVALRTEVGQKTARIGQLETEAARLAALVPVAVAPDIDQTVALLKGAGPRLEIGAGVKARFGRLGRFVEALKTRRA